MIPLIYLVLALWPWFGFARYPIHSFDVALGALTASFILCLVFNWSGKIYHIVRHDFGRKTQIVIAVVMLVQVFQLSLHFPGLVSSADLYLLEPLSRGLLSPWQSNSYSLIIQACQFIFASPLHVSILNFFGLNLVLFLFLRLLPKKPSLFILTATLLIFCMPQVSTLVFFENRDSLNSVLIIWLSLGFIAQLTEFKNEPWFGLATLTVLTLFLGDVRQEGKMIVVLFPVVICWIRKKPPLVFFKSYIAIGIAALILYWVPAHFFLLDSYNSDYQATAIINPLNFILHKKGITEISDQEFQELRRFFKVHYLFEDSNPLNIEPFFQGGIRQSHTDEDFAIFQKTARKIIWRNLPLFFEDREIMAPNILNFEGHPYAYDDTLSDLHEHKEVADWFHIQEKPKKLSPLAEFHRNKYLATAYSGLPPPWRILYSSCLIPILVMLFALVSWRTRPEIFAPAALNLARLAIILLLTPAAYFKYITSFWVMGWLLLIYIFAWGNGRLGSGPGSIARTESNG